MQRKREADASEEADPLDEDEQEKIVLQLREEASRTAKEMILGFRVLCAACGAALAACAWSAEHHHTQWQGSPPPRAALRLTCAAHAACLAAAALSLRSTAAAAAARNAGAAIALALALGWGGYFARRGGAPPPVALWLSMGSGVVVAIAVYVRYSVERIQADVAGLGALKYKFKKV
ncbi:hypothetical protein JKP88DRAFT_261364 [Tribonema minus]|uniref:Uncharacterized protein n=1 Tax=Tribonema minus TaxID=303371 RepID=A0A836CBZ7_9STRA|nr:hypothetical protein JKP88DRAFT_261364 [Tribonema minus]